MLYREKKNIKETHRKAKLSEKEEKENGFKVFFFFSVVDEVIFHQRPGLIDLVCLFSLL